MRLIIARISIMILVTIVVTVGISALIILAKTQKINKILCRIFNHSIGEVRTTTTYPKMIFVRDRILSRTMFTLYTRCPRCKEDIVLASNVSAGHKQATYHNINRGLGKDKYGRDRR